MEPVRPMNKPTLIFDLGGVFIELTGVSTMLEWTRNRLTVDELWSIWFSSDHVKEFESGRLNASDFALGVIQDFDLPVSADEFLVHFSSWSNQMFPGSRRLLSFLKEQYTLVSLSNTNVIHWTNMCDQFGIDRYFHFNFPSHHIGRVKPEIDTFTYVIEKLPTTPSQLYFFDDNPTNIESAKKAGIKAFRVVGIDELNRTLTRLALV